jgi:hypothetical protein
MLCRCIQTSAEVRAIVLRNPSFHPSFVTEWNSGDRRQVILWSATSNSDVIFQSVTLQTQVLFAEIIDQAEWGTLYYAMQTVSGSCLSFFLPTVYDVGGQSHLQDCGGSNLSRSVCVQWIVRQSTRIKFPCHFRSVRCLCHIAGPRQDPSHTGSCCLDGRVHHRPRRQLH